MSAHIPVVKMRRVAVIGTRWQFLCEGCGAKGPLMDKEAAEHCKRQHEWENHLGGDA